jgi:YHS domain-containing protein
MAKSIKKISCKVCPKWEIKIPERCSNTLVKSGKKIYFCTKKCKERFEKAPEKFK